jgi:hypothetical protein
VSAGAAPRAKAVASRGLRRRRLPAHLRAVDRIEGMISLREADLLYRLAARANGCGCIVEIGSYRGRSTVALAEGASSSAIFAIEPHEVFEGVLGGSFGARDRAHFYRAMLRSGAYERVRLVNLPGRVVAPGWSEPVALLWIDGDHSYEGVRGDWEAFKPHLAAGALVAFDDSIDERVGPHRLIAELVESRELTIVERVDKLTALRRPAAI